MRGRKRACTSTKKHSRDFSMHIRLLAKPDCHGRYVKQECTGGDAPPDHRITEWFGSEGTFKGHLMKCNEHGNLLLDQVNMVEVAFCGFFLRFLPRLKQTTLSKTSGPWSDPRLPWVGGCPSFTASIKQPSVLPSGARAGAAAFPAPPVPMALDAEGINTVGITRPRLHCRTEQP